ncbi:hypothetical protein CPC16_001034 [Podila verticillata]|nr:hypothetical protein CPC16_001034 [Podila verticillata]KAI9242209.1 MAG: hypothetical protein BYD32DRAFT_480590 [Podila humilis]
MSDMLVHLLCFFVMLYMLASSDAQAGPSDPDQTFQCPNAGYFCATIKPRAYGMTSYALQSPISPLVSFASPDPSRGGGGGGGGHRDEIAKFYACSSSNARSVPIAQCPQNECVQGYCAGGGPARVPQRLRDGDGLYCGRTIIDQIGRGRRVQDIESPAKGGGGAVGGGGGGGGDGSDGSYDEYVSDNLYYFSGSQGINLGPCHGRCVSAGKGQADYCEGPAGLSG